MLTEFLSQTAMNLALATISPACGLLLDRLPPARMRAGALALGFVWLVFLPNTTYLVTEWRHFLYDEPFTTWRAGGQADRGGMLMTALAGALYTGYTLFGVVAFTVALRPVARRWRALGHRPARWAPPLFLLVSLGVYVGLVDRLNSWDVLAPGRVLACCANALARPRALLAIVAFAAFHALAYVSTGFALDGYAAAWRRLRASRRTTSTTSAASPIAPRSPPAIRE